MKQIRANPGISSRLWADNSYDLDNIRIDIWKTLRPDTPGDFIEILAFAQKYDLQFVDRFDEIKTLTELERVIWGA